LTIPAGTRPRLRSSTACISVAPMRSNIWSVQQRACGVTMTFVEFENGVVRVRRLRVEDVQAGTGNLAFLQDFGQGSLVDHWAARAVDQKGRRLHQSEPPGIDEMPRLLRQRAIDGNEIRLAKDRIQIDEPDPEFAASAGST